MPQQFLRTSAIRRSAVYLALSLVCAANAASVLHLLLRWDHSWHVRLLQLLAVVAQGCLTVSLAVVKHEPPIIEFSSIGCIGIRSMSPLATFTAGDGALLSEALLLLFHATLSWYPLEAVDADTCHPPRVNTLMLQGVVTACTAILGIPVDTAMHSWLLVPMYCYLDWRYAALNGIPGTASLLQYISHRGVLMVLSKLFFSAIPALAMMQSNAAQQAAVYVVCIPLLAVQCFVSGIRIYNGIDSGGLWEVWVATVVAFGVGTDFGYVVEDLRSQFSRVRMIADDVLPRHVVDSLMQQDDEGSTDQERSTELLRSFSVDQGKLSLSTVLASPRHSLCSSGSLLKLRANSVEQVAYEGSMASPRRSPARKMPSTSGIEVAEYAEEHPNACILFADVCGFTSISEGTSPITIVNMLNELFSKFDDIIAACPFLYKLDVIGDCYMVASGLLWHAGDACPARTITDFATLMLKTAATVLDPVTQQPLSMRCGIHQGPVVGALLGRVRRKYSLFGDVVNAASRLESTSRPGALHVSAAIYQQIIDVSGFNDSILGYLSTVDSTETDFSQDTLPLQMNNGVRLPSRTLQTPAWKNMPLLSAFGAGACSLNRAAWGFIQNDSPGMHGILQSTQEEEAPWDYLGAEGEELLQVSSCANVQDAWMYRGSIELKGRAALETYILQVV